MSPPHPLPCPACAYDLGAISSDPLHCPECGGTFDRASLAARTHASTSLALSLLACGTLAAIVLSAAGFCIEYMPHGGEAISGVGAEASRLLGLMPFLALAYGVAMLALATGQSPLDRRWPVIAACTFAVATIVRIGTASQWSWADYSPWLQPDLWRTISEWVLIFADGMLLLAAATVLQRALVTTGSTALRRLLNLVCITAVASILFSLAARLHTSYVESVNNAGPSSFGNAGPAPALLPFFKTSALTGSIASLAAIAWWLGWSALGLLALHTRALWKAG